MLEMNLYLNIISLTRNNFVSFPIMALSVSSIDFVIAENLNSLLNSSNLSPEKLLIVLITAVLS